MTAYILVDVEVTDSIPYEEYKALAAQTVGQYGGKYIVRGGRVEALEGEWPLHRFVILEFPTAEQARLWLNSPEYAPARAMRYRYARSKMVLVEGVGEGSDGLPPQEFGNVEVEEHRNRAAGHEA